MEKRFFRFRFCIDGSHLLKICCVLCGMNSNNRNVCYNKKNEFKNVHRASVVVSFIHVTIWYPNQFFNFISLEIKEIFDFSSSLCMRK